MKVHFISIGGSVMHQLAIALKRKGYEVTGSDDEIFEPSRTNLLHEGLLPATMGWDAALLSPDIDAVILGMHAKSDNPEIAGAKELNLPVYSFPEYIYQESRNKTRIVVGGSHGKTTTTSMVMHVLKYAQKKFDYLVGARLQGFEQSVNITDAPLIVCEGDEYPASAIERKPKFHFLFPHVAVITGIAWDHINVFPTFKNYLQQFVIFISKIEKGGLLIYNETDEVLNNLVQEHRRNDITYQPYALPDHEIKDNKTVVAIDGITTELKVFGNHNLLNLNAAWYVCRYAGIDATTFTNAIADFTGASKRLEEIASFTNGVVFRDFAHAPSKVKATIEAVKKQFPARRLVAVLELHTFSSLSENFMNEYRGVLDAADDAAVFYSAHALELKRMQYLPKEKVLTGFAKDNLAVITDKEQLHNWLLSKDFGNSCLVLMSSGNFDGLDLNALVNAIGETN